MKNDEILSVPNPVTRICQSSDGVESSSYQGFVLKEIIYEDRVVIGRECGSTTTQMPTYSMTQVDMTKPFVTRVPLFVMQQSGDMALANMQGQLETMREKAATAREAERVALEKLAGAEKVETSLKERLADSIARQAGELDVSRRLREANRALEQDIAKVRTAVGELRMKEILNPTLPRTD